MECTHLHGLVPRDGAVGRGFSPDPLTLPLSLGHVEVAFLQKLKLTLLSHLPIHPVKLRGTFDPTCHVPDDAQLSSNNLLCSLVSTVHSLQGQ